MEQIVNELTTGRCVYVESPDVLRRVEEAMRERAGVAVMRFAGVGETMESSRQEWAERLGVPVSDLYEMFQVYFTGHFEVKVIVLIFESAMGCAWAWNELETTRREIQGHIGIALCGVPVGSIIMSRAKRIKVPVARDVQKTD